MDWKRIVKAEGDATRIPGAMGSCAERVPTNTSDLWYQELRTIGTELCSLEFNQSTDDRWIRVILRFHARTVVSPDTG
jgi:hypothetical protein